MKQLIAKIIKKTVVVPEGMKLLTNISNVNEVIAIITIGIMHRGIVVGTVHVYIDKKKKESLIRVDGNKGYDYAKRIILNHNDIAW